MQGISCWIAGHDHPLNIRFDNLGDRGFDGHQREVNKERQCLLLVGKGSCLQFPYHGLTRYEEVRVTVSIPPFPCPVSPSDHFWLCAHLVIEAWDGCLYVYPLTHTLLYLCIPRKQGLEPNTGAHLLLEAAARHERTL
jgi:hypothetical protein